MELISTEISRTTDQVSVGLEFQQIWQLWLWNVSREPDLIPDSHINDSVLTMDSLNSNEVLLNVGGKK